MAKFSRGGSLSKLSKTARKALLRGVRGKLSGATGEPPGEAPASPLAGLAQLDWVRVSSSNVAAGAYVADFKRLYLRFKSGSIYKYEGIDPGMWQGFLSAPSKGQWVYWILRAKGTDSVFAYNRVA